MKKEIYLDYNATTPVDSRVLEAMLPYFRDKFGNPSSSHLSGQTALRAIDKARSQVASLIGANVDEIIFTSSGTEANNLAIIGLACKLKTRGNHIVTSSIEHSSVYKTCRYLENIGFSVTYLEANNQGLLNSEAFKNALTDKTILASVMLANNETGVIQNISALTSIAHENKIFFHSDAVQAASKIPVDVISIGADMLTLSAHKIYAPKGVGALYIRRGISIDPILKGGGQEKKLRAGTENVPAIVGFGKAAELAAGELSSYSESLSSLRNLLESEILSRIPGSKINGSHAPRVPNTSNITFKDAESETLLVKLDLRGIFVSSGSACGAASIESSRTLKAMGLSESELHSSLRFSLGLQTTREDILYTADTLEKILIH